MPAPRACAQLWRPMGRRLCAAALSGDMRHEALTHRDGDARQPRRRGRHQACGRRRRGRAYGPTEGRSLARRPAERRSLRPPRRAVRFSVTSPPGRRGTKPPASLRGTMENGSTGQMRSGNPPPSCGGGCAGARKPRFGARPHGKAQSGQRASLKARPGPGREVIRTARNGCY